MASYRPAHQASHHLAAVAHPYVGTSPVPGAGAGLDGHTPAGTGFSAPAVSRVPDAPAAPAAPLTARETGEWNPTADTVRPVRGRHRVVKQRNSGMARSGAVLGVGMVAAIGAGGMATANEGHKPPISAPDLASAAQGLASWSSQLPGVDALVGQSADEPTAAPFTQAGVTEEDLRDGQVDAGEALRARILAQAERQQEAADQAAARQAMEEAADQAAEKAAKAEAKRKAEEAAAKRRAEEAARRKAEAERLARLARSYTAPLASYQLSSGFGESGAMWSSTHTGQDFAAPTGTPVKAVHSGTVKEAGWAGAYGYRIVLELADGTEIWYCHLSSMTVTGGEVTTGDVIGRVGSTGNSTGPHLHLEVRPGGGDPVAPLPWLREKGVNI